MTKEKIAKSKTTFVETGRIELSIRVPNLLPEKAAIIARDIRFALENSARLNLLDEFSMERKVGYIEVPMEVEI